MECNATIPPVKCSHCMVEFHDNPQPIYVGADVDGDWGLVKRMCPACKRIILNLQNAAPNAALWGMSGNQRVFSGFNPTVSDQIIRPKATSRPPVAVEVPKKFADDYLESCVVNADSPKAAAALGRRCLQNLLREIAGVKPGNLADEIQQVIDGGKLPSDLNESIDAVRNIGNFAAHPLKSQHSGEIMDVEPNEADWTLDVLEELFDFYFVRPAQRQKKRDALNQKLAAAGKHAMK
jgi:hypothetical protein